jgi:VWFA-related protein
MNRPGILCVRFAVFSALLVGLFTGSISLTAQGPAQDQSSTGNQAPFHLKVESNLVVMRVVVRDAHGRPVEGLKREDFKIFDRGKEQSITQFEESSSAPSSAVTGGPDSGPSPERFIALFFDNLNTSPAAMMQARDAADSRLAAVLRPTDQVAVFTSDKVLTDFTSDPKRIHDALSQLQGSSTTTLRKMECPNLSDFQALQILRGNSDAINVALDEIKSCSPGFSGSQNSMDVAPNDKSVISIRMLAQRIVDQSESQSRADLHTLEQLVQYLSRLSGERTITLVSPGFLSVSEQMQLDRIVNRALRSQIVVNTLDPKGVAVQMRGAMDRYTASSNTSVTQAMQTLDAQAGFVASDVLAELAQGTGGEFVHGNNDLQGGFEAVAGHPANYTIGFAPKDIKLDGNFHPLKVMLAKMEKGYSLQARRGYFAVASPAEDAVEAKSTALPAVAVAETKNLAGPTEGTQPPANAKPPLASSSTAPVGKAATVSARKSAPDDQSRPPVVEVTLRDWLDAGHVRPGQSYAALVSTGWSLPGCSLLKGTVVQIKITAVSKHSKQSPVSTMAIGADFSDCTEDKNPSKPLQLIAVIAADPPVTLPNVTPVDLRELNAGWKLAPDLSNVHFGQVVGIPGLKMQIEGGPDKSTLLTDSGRSVRLVAGTTLLFSRNAAMPVNVKFHVNP